MRSYIEVLEKRNEEMAVALEKERIRYNHIEQAFNLIKREDSSLLRRYEQQLQEIRELE